MKAATNFWQKIKSSEKVISFITILALITALLPIFELPAFAAGEITTISTLEQLEQLAAEVDAGTDYSGKTITLTADIDMSAKYGKGKGSWNPIGTGSKSFKGTFDGGGHTISGLYMNSSSGDFAALFVESSGTIKNLKLTGINITNDYYACGVCCINEGIIENCSVSGTITSVSTNGMGSGGIVGYNSGTISKCSSECAMTTMLDAGGIAAINADNGTITECYNTGAVTNNASSGFRDTGGIVGELRGGNIENCYNIGTVSGGSSSDSNAGGVVGSIEPHPAESATVNYCYNFAGVSGSGNIGGIVGGVSCMSPSVVTVDGIFNRDAFTGNAVGSTSGEGTIDDYATHRTEKDFFSISPSIDEKYKFWDFTDTWAMSNSFKRPYLKENPERSEVRYQIDSGEWYSSTYIDAVYAAYTATSSVNIELLEDIEADWTESPEVGNGNNIPWTIDGKGHMCKRATTTQYLFPITTPNSNVTFKDITIDGGAVWSNDDPKTRINNGVKLTGNSHLISVSGTGSNVYLGDGAVLQNNAFDQSGLNGAAVSITNSSLTMESGAEIRDNSAVETSSAGGGAGAVQINSGGTFTMNGGEIYGNYASSLGGAIVNQGTFIMNGGSIYNNYAPSNGGGVLDAGSFTMTDGEIRGNSSRLGGGVLVNGGTFAMSGGKIHENTATGNGGGIYFNSTAFSVSGTAQVTDNTLNENANNVYLPDKTITVSGALKPGAAMGVTTKTVPTGSGTVNITGANSADCSEYFTSDNSAYMVQKGENNVVQLAVKPPHNHTLTPHEAVDPTCTEDGTGEYWKCEGTDGCGMMFSDANGTTEITKIPAGETATGHDWDSWTITEDPTMTATGTAERVCKNDTERDHVERVTLSELTDDTVWTPGEKKKPTETEGGWQKYTSEYGEVTVTISATGQQHQTDSEVIIKDNTPEVKVEGLDQIVEEADPTAENVKVTMTVEKKEEDSSNTEQNEIKAISENTNMLYLDIKLTKTVDSVVDDIPETTNSLKIMIPFDRAGKKNIKVYRWHNGDAAPLSNQAVDGEYYTVGSKMVTVYAKRFSTYAIGYDISTSKPYLGSIGGGSSSVSDYYTITLNGNNGSQPTRIRAEKNAVIEEPKAPVKEGYTFDGWYTDSKLTTKYDFSETVSQSFTLYAKWTEDTALQGQQHKAYIVGYGGSFYPDRNITRAEIAAILARVTENFDENGAYEATFSDVNNALWYGDYIGFAEGHHMITGYADGTFRPENSVTRAEFASMIARFAGLDDANADTAFTDISGHWAEKQIGACYHAGYIVGYGDNLFMPNHPITRAEAVTIVNRVLNRHDLKDYDNPFGDITSGHWAYGDIMEGAVPHKIGD